MQNDKPLSRLGNPVIASLLAALCGVLWGTAYPGIKSGYALFAVAADDTAAKLVFAGCRFLLAGAMVLVGQAIVRLVRKSHGDVTVDGHLSLDLAGFSRIVLLGLFQCGFQYFFFYVGLAYTTGAKGSIINSTSVFFSALLANIFYKNDKLSLCKIIGLILGFSGVILVNYSEELGFSFTVHGEGFVMIAACVFSLSGVYSKQLTKKLDPVLVSGGHLVVGGLALLLVGLAMGASFPSGGFGAWLVLGYLAVLSALTYTIWTALLKHNKVGSITIYNFLIPVSGTVLSALVLHESVWQTQYYLAVPAVAIGIYLVNSQSGKKAIRLAHSTR
ncbi:MAG: DMT family transporter [Sphaerochaetaceae bacterium]